MGLRPHLGGVYACVALPDHEQGLAPRLSHRDLLFTGCLQWRLPYRLCASFIGFQVGNADQNTRIKVGERFMLYFFNVVLGAEYD